MINILFVEDDMGLGYALEFSLIDEGFNVVRVDTLKDARNKFSNDKFDIIILDVNLPDGNGYEFCKYIRKKSKIPIIFLTALDDEVNIVMGLEIGGNDYLTKPFGFRELLARINVQIRSRVENYKVEKLISREVMANLLTTQGFKGEEPLSLTALEYKLLTLFMNNPFKTMKRDDILEGITRDGEVFFDENTLSVYIKRLREKIEDNPKDPKYIVTQRGVGYRWDAEVRSE
ncbi:response regulator transcription factor [Clostridium sp. UBA7503]|uniref:response regulator transcription factor n=1 Tax=Clostridium sp. UBA7503 TaxID=1946377 RepID=UPI0032165636